MFEDVCCFTGHRYLPADRLGEIKKRLEAESEAWHPSRRYPF